MYCTSCGNEMHEDAIICVKCGVATNNTVVKPKTEESDLVYLWAILGCCVPVVGIGVGIVMYLIGYPKSGKAVGIGVLISFALMAIYYAVVIVFGVAAGLSSY